MATVGEAPSRAAGLSAGEAGAVAVEAVAEGAATSAVVAA